MKYHRFFIVCVWCMFIIAIVLIHSCAKETRCGSQYAPANITLNWDDYNDLEVVAKYFQEHDSTIEEHRGRQIKVSGFYRENGYWAYLTSDSLSPYRYSVPLYIPEGMMVNPPLDRERKNNITAKVFTLPWDTLCHSYMFCLLITNDYE